jgi:cholesterol transport system auxiliary component
MSVLSLLRASVLCLGVGGCAMAGMNTAPAPATYNINAPDTRDLGLPRWPVQLIVQTPTAGRAVDTGRIMVTAPSGRVSYFADAAWSDRLPRLLQSQIVTALQDSGAFRAVLTTHDRLDGDYALAVEVRSFQIEVARGGGTAAVALYARMINEKRGNVLAAKEFSARVPSVRDDPDSGVAALQTGFNKVTSEMVRWAASFRGRHAAG